MLAAAIPLLLLGRHGHYARLREWPHLARATGEVRVGLAGRVPARAVRRIRFRAFRRQEGNFLSSMKNLRIYCLEKTFFGRLANLSNVETM